VYSSYAAMIAAANVEDRDAVGFCSQFQLGSRNWGAAFHRLERRPRALVMPYIRTVCASGAYQVRYICYSVCLNAGWDDLLDAAWVDMFNDTIFEGKGLTEKRLSDMARPYVDRFAKKP
jgi:hypothetical protein